MRKIAGSDHHVQVHDVQHGDTAARAKKLGVRSLPAVVINGKLAGKLSPKPVVTLNTNPD